MGFVYFFIVTSQLVEESFKKGAVDEDTGTLTGLTVLYKYSAQIAWCFTIRCN